MSLSGKMFMVVFVLIAAVSFVGFLAYLQGHSSAANVTISTVQDSYYNASTDVNKSINQSIVYGKSMVGANSAFPMLIIIFFVGCGLYLMLLTGKKK